MKVYEEEITGNKGIAGKRVVLAANDAEIELLYWSLVKTSRYFPKTIELLPAHSRISNMKNEFKKYLISKNLYKMKGLKR